MKIQCNRAALVDALSIAAEVVPSRAPKPVLMCVRLEAGKDGLRISATDMEVSLRTSVAQVEVIQPGVVVANAGNLLSIARAGADETLALELVGDLLHVRGEDAEFKVYTQPEADFPALPQVGEGGAVEIGGSALKALISQTAYAAAREASRYALNGVLVAVDGRGLTLVATDGRRLALARDMSASRGDRAKMKAVVPVRAMTLLARMLPDGDEPVHVVLTENQLSCRVGPSALTTNLLEGQFPPYEDVIPKAGDRKLSAEREAFLSAVERVSLLRNEETKGVRMQFSSAGLVCTTLAPGAGEATVRLRCRYAGPDIEIGFNPEYLVEALRVAPADDVTFEMTAANRPGLLRAGENFLYVLMPVSLE